MQALTLWSGSAGRSRPVWCLVSIALDPGRSSGRRLAGVALAAHLPCSALIGLPARSTFDPAAGQTTRQPGDASAVASFALEVPAFNGLGLPVAWLVGACWGAP